jgi:hypothetical protein
MVIFFVDSRQRIDSDKQVIAKLQKARSKQR